MHQTEISMITSWHAFITSSILIYPRQVD